MFYMEIIVLIPSDKPTRFSTGKKTLDVTSITNQILIFSSLHNDFMSPSSFKYMAK